MDLYAYIKTEFLALIPILVGVGAWLKKSRLPDKYIPLTLGGVGVTAAIAYTLIGGTGGNIGAAILSGAMQGVLCAAGAVYGNQLVKQSGKVE